MKKPCILQILSRTLQHQAVMARILAEPNIQDLSERKKLLEEVNLTAAEFRRLVPEFQLQIEKRKELPRP
jgi:hypothetical protein